MGKEAHKTVSLVSDATSASQLVSDSGWRMQRVHLECERLRSDYRALQARYEALVSEGSARMAKLEGDRRFLVEEVDEYQRLEEDSRSRMQESLEKIKALEGHKLDLELRCQDLTGQLHASKSNLLRAESSIEKLRSQSEIDKELHRVEVEQINQICDVLRRELDDLKITRETKVDVVPQVVDANDVQRQLEDHEKQMRRLVADNRCLGHENRTLREAQRTSVRALKEEVYEMRAKLLAYRRMEQDLLAVEDENARLKSDASRAPVDSGSLGEELAAKNAELSKATEEIARLRRVISTS
jgi:chromosome segregation ATPase